MTAFAFMAIKNLPKSRLTQIGFLGVGIFYGIATIIVSLFPCNKGCDKEFIDPSLSQLLHNLSGLLTYIIVPISLIIIGVSTKNGLKTNIFRK